MAPLRSPTNGVGQSRLPAWLAAAGLVALVLGTAVGPLHGADALQILEVDLGAETVWMDPVRWQGRAAVSAFTRKEQPRPAGSEAKPDEELAVQMVVLEPDGPRVAARWPLPAGTRYVEPLRLGGDALGWLLLVEAEWQAARLQDSALALTPLCTCQSLYGAGGAPDPDDVQLVRDLDGDGVDEVLLPTAEHLLALRLEAGRPEPVLLWRARWNPEGTPLRPSANGRYALPRVDVAVPQQGGPPALVNVERQRVLVAPLSAPAARADADTPPELTPYAVPLEGMGAYGEKDRPWLLGLADMDGDGVLDVLHAKLLNYGSVFSQQNELRWYRGQITDGRLSFAPARLAMRSDAGSFAELVRLRRDGTPPLAVLLATTEVSLGTLMKALASQSVTLQASLIPWKDGALAEQPLARGEFTYRDLRAAGRRAMFLFADLNGDGWRDAVLNVNAGELQVFLSAGGAPGLVTPSLVQRDLPLPSRRERVLVTDLDGDGREELVLRYRESFHNGLAGKLRLVRLPP